VLGPKNMPPDILKKVSDEVVKAIATEPARADPSRAQPRDGSLRSAPFSPIPSMLWSASA
jgi:hypothetical protein